MSKMLRKRLNREEEGFTLIELMVVVLIIAILIAIAIPTFLGARERAQDRAAQSNLRNALTAEKTHYTDAEAYTADVSTSTGLAAIEPSLTWVSSSQADSADNNGDVHVQLDAANDQVVCLTAKSASGKLFAIGDVATGSNPGTYYNSDYSSFTCNEATVTGWDTDGF